jgi:hypothetical protein
VLIPLKNKLKDAACDLKHHPIPVVAENCYISPVSFVGQFKILCPGEHQFIKIMC